MYLLCSLHCYFFVPPGKASGKVEIFYSKLAIIDYSGVEAFFSKTIVSALVCVSLHRWGWYACMVFD